MTASPNAGNTPTHAENLKKLTELTKGMRIGMLTTVSESGDFVSRPMAQQDVEFSGELWFLADLNSRKVAHIKANPHVGLTLTDRDTWISIDGRAEVLQDSAKVKELWNPMASAWFPNGPDDPNIAVIKVSAEGAEYWDTPGGWVSTAISFVTSTVLHRRPDVGENEKLDLG